jgi:glutamine synthetase
MLLMPDPETAFIDPVAEIPTLVITCDVYDPITLQPYERDPRYVARKAEAYLKQTGIADTVFFGPEAEFFIFDNVRYGGGTNESYYHVDSEEGWWNSGRADRPNFGGQISPKRGYFPVPPTDTLQTVRGEIVLALEAAGIPMEVHHHEVATAGQTELGMRFTTLTRMADQLLVYKYIAKNVARKNGKTVTFMPKPLFGDNGSGMHVHSSLWKGDTNVFYDASGYAGLSQAASSNPYLCFAAVLMAGLDGILNRIDPGEPSDKDLYELPAEEAKLIKQVPGSLGEVLDALEADCEFLVKGDVFTGDFIDAYIAYKRQVELDPVRIRPTPYEFTLYFDC